MQWYYIQNGQRIGPVEEADFFRLARERKLSPDDLVWNPTLGQEWKPASSVPGLFAAPAAAVPGTPGATHNRDLMGRARASLAGQWVLAVGATLLYQLVTGGVQFVPYVGALVILLVYGPMVAGWSMFFLQIARGESPQVGVLFGGFKRFGTALGAYLLITLLIILWCLPLILPALFAALAVPLIDKTPALGVLLVPLLVLLGGLALFPVVRATLSYAQVFFILADHSEVGALESIRRSKEMMRGFKWKLFCLGWRFFGWGLLVLCTCGIGFLWLQPYMAVSNAHFYDDIRNGT